MSKSVSYNSNKVLRKTHHGYSHWINQRISAVVLIFFSIWTLYFIAKISKSSIEDIIIIMKEPLNIFFSSTFVFFGLYHGALGMQVIIEDYISCVFMRNVLIVGVKIVSLLTAFIFFIGLMYNLLF